MSRPLVAVIGRRAAHVPILRFSATLGAEAICEAVWAAGGEPVGFVESIEDPERWYLGVQWHPEDEDGSYADRMRLFSAFVEAAEQTRQDRVA